MAEAFFDVRDPTILDGNQSIVYVKRWLSDKRNTKWLLIFDNYDEPDSFSLREYCPYTAHGSVIVTSRLPDRVQGHIIRLQPLQGLKEQLMILETRSGREDVMTDPHARKLVQRLGGLPLALATTGAYLRRSTYSFEKYLQEYERSWNVDQHWSAQLPEYERTLYTTWGVSYDLLKSEDARAAQLLGLLAYFSNRRLWYELFEAGLPDDEWVSEDGTSEDRTSEDGTSENGTSAEGLPEDELSEEWLSEDEPSENGSSKDSLPQWLHGVVSSSSAFESAMGKLTDYCFLEVQASTQSWSMHMCVHDWTFASINRVPDKTQYLYAIDCVGVLIEREDKRSLALFKFSDLAAHALRLEHVCRHHDALLESAPRRIERVGRITDLLREQSQLSAAERLLRRTLQMCEETLESNHELTFTVIHNLGILYHAQGKLEQSEAMFSRALQGREETLGPTHKRTLSTLSSLGVLYDEQGKMKEAEEMYLRALQGQEEALGAKHRETLSTIHNLGVFYKEQGRTEEAEEMYLRALEGKEEALGATHVDTLGTVNNLGVLYWIQGKMKKAEDMYQRALQGRQEVLGAKHTFTSETMANYGVLYRDQGKVTEARKMFTLALEGYEYTEGAHEGHITLLRIALAELSEDEGSWS